MFITGRDEAKLKRAVESIGKNAVAIRADTTSLTDIDRLYEQVKADTGRIDVLFANAGFYELGRFGEVTENHLDQIFNTNVRGLLFTVQKALPLLSSGASVILTGSIAAIKGFPSLGSTTPAKRLCVRSPAPGSWISRDGVSGSTSLVQDTSIRPDWLVYTTEVREKRQGRACLWTGSALPMKSARSPSSSLPTKAAT